MPSDPSPAKPNPGFAEFITMMAMTMSLVALAIDAMLPAHGLIGAEFAVANSNDTQYIVYMVFMGLAVGQLCFGPVADSIGRKPALYIGLAIFVTGTFVSLFANTFGAMLFGRFLQGIGVAGPRTLTVAIVRDLFKGRQMARVMSFVVTVFILVPAIAPSLGQLILNIADWRKIFWSFLLLAGIIFLWFVFRQPETLMHADRQPLLPGKILRNFVAVLKTRAAVGYTVAGGLVSGAFVGFLGTAQQIFQQQYGLAERFPHFFALLALSVGTSTLINGRIVVRFGMRPLAKLASVLLTVCACALLAANIVWQGQPPLAVTMLGLMSVFLFIGFLFGNLNALAMEPLGHIAGTAASAIGAATTLISAILGTLVGAMYDGTTLAMAASFVLLGGLTALCIFATDRD
ncbi:MAG: multidrug effflux MFS transporter [Pseudomonadota bacterium]